MTENYYMGFLHGCMLLEPELDDAAYVSGYADGESTVEEFGVMEL